MTQNITIEHTCEGCGLTIYVPAKDRLLGHVNKGYPDGWEHIRDKNLCTGCSQDWRSIVDAAWTEYQERMRQKGEARKLKKA